MNKNLPKGQDIMSETFLAHASTNKPNNPVPIVIGDGHEASLHHDPSNTLFINDNNSAISLSSSSLSEVSTTKMSHPDHYVIDRQKIRSHALGDRCYY